MTDHTNDGAPGALRELARLKAGDGSPLPGADEYFTDGAPGALRAAHAVLNGGTAGEFAELLQPEVSPAAAIVADIERAPDPDAPPVE